jgi:putative DNA primase/helicase
VPFSAFFPAGKADPDLINVLTSVRELQGLLRRAVGGLQSVMRRGAFTLPPSVVNATDKFRREADPIRGYIDERIRQDPHKFTPRSDVYGDYAAWCGVNGFHAMSASRFYEAFITAASASIRIKQRIHKGIRGFVGINLLEM